MSGGVLVGGEPRALLGASSALGEVAQRTEGLGLRLAQALAPAGTSVAAMIPFAPLRARSLLQAVEIVVASPHAGLGAVVAAFHGTSLQLRQTGQMLEAAGAVGLLASGGLGLLRGERPTVLGSAEGVDLRREAVTGSWSVGDVAQSSAVAVREVRRPDGTTFFVVELTTGTKYARSLGVQVNGFGSYAEAGAGGEVTMRWAVPTRRDAELLVAAVAVAMSPVARRNAAGILPKPTETSLATVGSATGVGSILGIPGTSASGNATVRHEVTLRGGGGQRFATSVGGAGQVGLPTGGTGGAGSVTVAVQRSPSGVVDRLSVTSTTEADRGRHGRPVLEAGNREGTLVEREVAVELTPEARAAAERIAAALARGDVPAESDLAAVAAAPGIEVGRRTYDTRHQAASADVSPPWRLGGGGVAAVDTADLRR